MFMFGVPPAACVALASVTSFRLRGLTLRNATVKLQPEIGHRNYPFRALKFPRALLGLR